MTFLLPLLQREVIIALAIVGAIVATIGSAMIRRDKRARGEVSPLANTVNRTGYAVTWGSVALFIVAGLVGA